MDHQLTPPLRPKPQSGAALIITLTLLLLITGLAISLFMTANTELQSASQFKNSQGLTELSDICVNLVMGQIKDATTTGATNTPATRSTWASQPGMIRTYASSTNAAMSYKLYSWDGPRVSGEDTTSVPLTWFSNPALYTDLNEPIPNSTNPSPNFYRYPIAYPPLPATDTTRPLGYDVLPSAPRSTGGAFTNQVPMPVQWLYVLKDGTMVYPASASGSNATISGASAANPIVARVAYWTDDETSKVNINTAAGGDFWMTPKHGTTLGLDYAQWQPTRWEFQRYPGHPARTDLRAVFPTMTLANVYAMAPRVSDGGSTPTAGRPAKGSLCTPVSYDSDRLYASRGEFRFITDNSTTRQSPSVASLDWPQSTEKAGFFITASSRAPEVNLFGAPRISMWPINTSGNSTSVFDRLISFCSSLKTSTGTQPYYFVRNRNNVLSDAPTGDVNLSQNTKMFTYLDAIADSASIPGLGTSGLTSKYSTAGKDQLLTQFYDYIRDTNLIDKNPGQGSVTDVSFSSASHLPPVFRTVNGRKTAGFGRTLAINQVGIHFICSGDAATPDSNYAFGDPALSPTPPTPPPGKANLALDDFPAGKLTANQRRISTIVYVEPFTVSAGYPDLRFDVGFNYLIELEGLDQLGIRPAGSVAAYTSLGLPAGKHRVKLIGQTAANISGINIGTHGGALARSFLTLNGTTGRFLDLPPAKKLAGTTSASAGADNVNYPWVGIPLTIDVPASGNMELNGATITARVYMKPPSPATATELLVQSNSITFPAVTLPIPNLSADPAKWVFHSKGYAGDFTTFNGTTANSTIKPGRLRNDIGFAAVSVPERQIIDSTSDTVFAMAPAHGDTRLVMARQAENDQFAPVVNTAAANMRHRFFGGSTTQPGSAADTKVLGFATASSEAQKPNLPKNSDITGNTPLTYGDFDSGTAVTPDGAFINYADESIPAVDVHNFPYFSNLQWTHNAVAEWHSPNRKIASPVAFGSLPQAAVQNKPWQTLLFRPSGSTPHPGSRGTDLDGTTDATKPPDHAWLDLFWMPIVEPWAISETYSTAGKINLNHQIAPFTYIERTTALQALLRTERIPAVSSVNNFYGATFNKNPGTTAASVYSGAKEMLLSMNVPETLLAIQQKNPTTGLYRNYVSASEICEVPLIPTGITYANINSFWSTNQLTSDNLRELPYNNIYPRLTTKSNTYTVHYRVQMLKKLPGGDQTTWDESKDKVASELRGSTLIERFLDPNATYPDYATAFSTSASLETLYRFRVLQRSQFTP
jgi:uncharacterized protein (TIGR02600 family)